jgi:hypothetical protein
MKYRALLGAISALKLSIKRPVGLTLVYVHCACVIVYRKGPTLAYLAYC